MGILEQVILPLFILWFTGLLLVMFRSDVEFLWKITFVLVFTFYLFQFWPDINKSLDRLLQHYPGEIISWFYGAGKVMYFFLLILWPVTLLRIFYSANNQISRTVIVALISVTMIYWILFFIRMQFAAQIDTFVNNKVIHLLYFR